MNTSEIVELCEALQPEKREEVADFARFLLSRQHDAHWERIVEDSKPRSRLEAFLRDSAMEPAEAFDPDRL